MTTMKIPTGYVEMEDGSYAKLTHIQKGIVRGKPKVSSTEQREAEIHREIIDYCNGLGWVVHHSRMDRPSTCGVGSPDFVVALPAAKTLYVEVKSSTGKLSMEQVTWNHRLKKLGHHTAVVRSLRQFVEFAQEVMDGK